MTIIFCEKHKLCKTPCGACEADKDWEKDRFKREYETRMLELRGTYTLAGFHLPPQPQQLYRALAANISEINGVCND